MTGASEGQGQEIPSPGCAGPEHGAPGPSAFARQAEPAADGAHHDGGDEEGEETVPCASPACAQCGEGAARYRCPRCSIRTCSLECVRGHKKDTGCTGKRDRTAYVPISKFDDRQLGSGPQQLKARQALPCVMPPSGRFCP